VYDKLFECIIYEKQFKKHDVSNCIQTFARYDVDNKGNTLSSYPLLSQYWSGLFREYTELEHYDKITKINIIIKSSDFDQ